LVYVLTRLSEACVEDARAAAAGAPTDVIAMFRAMARPSG